MHRLLTAPLLLSVLVALGTPTSSSAQGQPPSVLSPPVRPGAPVRVQLRAGGLVEGAHVSSDSLVLRLRTSEEERAVPMESVVTLWERVPAPGRGARRGAIVGGVLLGGGGLALNYMMCDFDCDRAVGAAYGFAVGAGVGALVGAGWGALSGRWVQRLP